MGFLITGDCHFLGSHLATTILDMGAPVVHLGSSAHPPEMPDTDGNDQDADKDRYQLVKGNLWDDDLDIVDVLEKFEIQMVIYITHQSMDRKQEIVGLTNLFEAAHKYGKVYRVVFISTGQSHPTLEMVVKSHGMALEVDHVIIRCDQVYGPGQKTGKIPTCMKSMIENNPDNPCFVDSCGSNSRNFVYVDDVCNAVTAVMDRVGFSGEVFNVKGLDNFTTEQLFQRLKEFVPESYSKLHEVNSVPSKGTRSHDLNDLDDSSLRKQGWTPKTTFDDGIKKTLSWLQKHEAQPTVKPVWLVYGHNGWIGGKYCQFAESHVTVARGTARADDVTAVRAEMDDVNPAHVVCIIGRTHGPGCGTIDWLEQPGHLKHNVRDNLFGPVLLARECEERGIKMTYMGTGCIFKFTDDQAIFTEGDRPNFFGSSYSIVKGFTDQIAKFFSDTVLNCRIRMPISCDTSPRNFITKITTYEKICSIPNSMTVLEEILPIMVDMGRRGITGTYNMTNPGLISHNEILTMYQEIVNTVFTWKNFSHEEMLKILAADRSNNELNTDKLVGLYPGLRPIKEAVKETLLEMRRLRDQYIFENDIDCGSSAKDRSD